MIYYGKPLSLNSMYPTNRQGRRFLTTEGKAYKEAIKRLCVDLRVNEGRLRFSYMVYGPILTKQGNISKTAGDIDGWCKALMDACCEAAGVDDSSVIEIHAKKTNATEWRVEFSLVNLSND